LEWYIEWFIDEWDKKACFAMASALNEPAAGGRDRTHKILEY